MPITQTASLSQKEKKRLMKQDPYRWELMQQRKNAHLERRGVLQAERKVARGDPVRGVTTPFVESFDSAGQAAFSTPPVDEDGNPLEEPHALPTSPHVLNNLIHGEELEAAIANAYELTRPDNLDDEDDGSGGAAAAAENGAGSAEGGSGEGGEEGEWGAEKKISIVDEAANRADPTGERLRRGEHEAAHARAAEALRRILHLDAGSAKDRRHANVRRCVETFGRHNTDRVLRPRAPARGHEDDHAERAPAPRAGPDTGSSEVQIAILTAKIRALANELERGRGYRDKVGKRDLRLLVHRRQRLLRYMERRERGSERWTNLIATLGLTKATYQGQITI